MNTQLLRTQHAHFHDGGMLGPSHPHEYQSPLLEDLKTLPHIQYANPAVLVPRDYPT